MVPYKFRGIADFRRHFKELEAKYEHPEFNIAMMLYPIEVNEYDSQVIYCELEDIFETSIKSNPKLSEKMKRVWEGVLRYKEMVELAAQFEGLTELGYFLRFLETIIKILPDRLLSLRDSQYRIDEYDYLSEYADDVGELCENDYLGFSTYRCGECQSCLYQGYW